jgi:hypothetical protein
MNVMMLDSVDRLVYFEVFNDMQDPKKKLENNPYKQGSVSYMAWIEGWDYWDCRLKRS